MLFFIALALVFAFVIMAIVSRSDGVEFIGVIGALVCGVIFVIMLVSVVGNNITVEGSIAACEQRYEILTYQLENHLYDNDNDIGKKELYNQIQSWNEDLAEGKALQHDFWVGIFYPNIYDQFEFIELP